MTKTGYFLISILAAAAAMAPLNAQETGAQDREYWVSTMTRIADPVIRNMSKDRLRKKMPVETWPARENPSNRLLQKEMAKYMTIMVHSEEDYNKAIEASNILFGKATTEDLANLDEKTLLAVMKDVSKVEIPRSDVENGINVVDLAALHEKVTSKGEARKLIKGNGFSLNKRKVSNDKDVIKTDCLIDGRYMLLQKGKKDYTLVIAK